MHLLVLLSSSQKDKKIAWLIGFVLVMQEQLVSLNYLYFLLGLSLDYYIQLQCKHHTSF